MRKLLFLILLLPVSVFADAPIDLSGAGSSLTSYVIGAASAAIPLLLALWGLIIIVKSFCAVLGLDSESHHIAQVQDRYDELLEEMESGNTAHEAEFISTADELNDYYGVDED